MFGPDHIAFADDDLPLHNLHGLHVLNSLIPGLVHLFSVEHQVGLDELSAQKHCCLLQIIAEAAPAHALFKGIPSIPEAILADRFLHDRQDQVRGGLGKLIELS